MSFTSQESGVDQVKEFRPKEMVVPDHNWKGRNTKKWVDSFVQCTQHTPGLNKLGAKKQCISVSLVKEMGASILPSTSWLPPSNQGVGQRRIRLAGDPMVSRPDNPLFQIPQFLITGRDTSLKCPFRLCCSYQHGDVACCSTQKHVATH